ncbi:MAG: endonuclease III [Acidobacteriota bacterium]|nr:endonuclease III [Blastocatellia bacterium]MDW8240719.1 endonuclease III [Acidobacteriota bacterium]
MMTSIIERLEAVFGVPRPGPKRNPLDVLIETILSQSTTDINSRRAFLQLKRRFADWQQARRARAQTIADAIRQAGLANIKSVRIKRVLQRIHARCGSLDLDCLRRMPLDDAKAFLTSLEGVGPKTAACVLLFGCRRPVFPADTHILRVAKRLGVVPPACSAARAHELLGQLIPSKKYYSTHINLIRLGRRYCRPRHPRCVACPLLDHCRYAQQASSRLPTEVCA